MAIAIGKSNVAEAAHVAEPPKRLLIGLYRRTGGINEIYETFVGQEKDFVSDIKKPGPSYSLKLVSVHRIARHWEEDMEQHVSRYGLLNRGNENTPLTPLGFVTISFAGLKDQPFKIATTFGYYPKEEIHGERHAPGLGYATEWMILSSIGERITHVRTSNLPSMSREKQLKSVGLPIKEMVPVEDWMKGLLRGYKRSLKRMRQGQLSSSLPSSQGTL